MFVLRSPVDAEVGEAGFDDVVGFRGGLGHGGCCLGPKNELSPQNESSPRIKSEKLIKSF